jgi:hypothetical protein
VKCCQRSTLRGHCGREATVKMFLPRSKSTHPWQLLCPSCADAMRLVHPSVRIQPISNSSAVMKAANAATRAR